MKTALALMLSLAVAGCGSTDVATPTLKVQQGLQDLYGPLNTSNAQADRIINLAEQERAEKLDTLRKAGR